MKSTATVNPLLTGIAIGFMRDPMGFVGLDLFPGFNTGLQSAAYYKFNKANTLSIPQNIKRAPGAPFVRSMMTLSDDNYRCSNYGHETVVADEDRKKYSSAFDADVAAVRRNIEIVKVNHELRVKAKATDPSVPTSTPAIKWDDSLSNPVIDCDAAKESVRLNTGLIVNVMVINQDVFNILKEHPKILDKIKYTQRGVVTEEILANVFGVGLLRVAKSVINSAVEGQAITPANIWGRSVILAHVETAQDLQRPNFGRTFVWSEFTGADNVRVDSYREEEVMGDVHRSQHHTDEKLVGPEAGYHLSSVLT